MLVVTSGHPLRPGTKACAAWVLTAALACASPLEPGQVVLPTPPESTTQLGDSLALVLELPGEVLHGRPVPIVLRLRNAGPDPVRLRLGRSPRTHDVRVLDLGEREIWRFQSNVVPPRFEDRVLAPGEELAFGAEWPQLDQAGMQVRRSDYKAKGIVHTETGDLVTETRAFFVR